MAQKRFQDRTVIVTGASQGIGLAAARKFAEEGANVVLVARGAADLEKAREAISAIGPTLAIAADVADADGQMRIIEGTLAKFGAIHVLVNNAGYHTRGLFDAQVPEGLGKMVDVNLRAPIVLTSLALPHLRATRNGAIINVASLAGMVPVAGSATYSATKFGLRAFTFALAEELEGSGVTASCVSPGPVDTQFIMSELDTVSDLTMSQPIVSADAVAELVVACAFDGTRERALPKLSGALATLGYFAPPMRRVLKPLLERRGRRVKEKLRSRGGS